MLIQDPSLQIYLKLLLERVNLRNTLTNNKHIIDIYNKGLYLFIYLLSIYIFLTINPF